MAPLGCSTPCWHVWGCGLQSPPSPPPLQSQLLTPPCIPQQQTLPCRALDCQAGLAAVVVLGWAPAHCTDTQAPLPRPDPQPQPHHAEDMPDNIGSSGTWHSGWRIGHAEPRLTMWNNAPPPPPSPPVPSTPPNLTEDVVFAAPPVSSVLHQQLGHAGVKQLHCLCTLSTPRPLDPTKPQCPPTCFVRPASAARPCWRERTPLAMHPLPPPPSPPSHRALTCLVRPASAAPGPSRGRHQAAADGQTAWTTNTTHTGTDTHMGKNIQAC